MTLALVLQVLGAVALVAAGFLISAVVGFVVVGVVFVLAGVVKEREAHRGSTQPPA